MERHIPSAAVEQLTSSEMTWPLPPVEGTPNLVPPSAADTYAQPQVSTESDASNEIVHRHTTFEGAQRATRPLSNILIHAAITREPIKIGDTYLSMHGYLESSLVDDSDLDIIEDPDRIGAIHSATALVIANRLQVLTPTDRPDLHHEAQAAKRAYVNRLAGGAHMAGRALSDWCTLRGDFPADSMAFEGFTVQGKDVLDAAAASPECLPNISVKRTAEGTTLTGLSRVEHERAYNGTSGPLTRSIYINPRMDATPEVFEALLMIADQQGIPARIEMIDRASECVAKYYATNRGTGIETVRGNAIAIHLQEGDANTMLAQVLQMTQSHPIVFAGRRTGRVPQYVSDGVSVADRPIDTKLSLTAHRERSLREAGDRIFHSKVTASEYADTYDYAYRRMAQNWAVHQENIAFNAR